jgi:hypothetical protein
LPDSSSGFRLTGLCAPSLAGLPARLRTRPGQQIRYLPEPPVDRFGEFNQAAQQSVCVLGRSARFIERFYTVAPIRAEPGNLGFLVKLLLGKHFVRRHEDVSGQERTGVLDI